MSSWWRSDGQSDHTPDGNPGLVYPRRTASPIFRSGLVWGGLVQDPNPSKPKLRVGGQTYAIGTVSGWISVPGTPTTPPIAVDPSDPDARIFRIRRDYQSLSASDREVILEAADWLGINPASVPPSAAQEVLDQYALDWQDWPGHLGAPYYDLNSNGQWDPGVDEPGLQDADQVIWFVCNDELALQAYGSPQIGLELQVTVWGYNGSGILENTHYRRYRLINKSGFEIKKMHIASWSDTDIGLFNDDLAACDTTTDTGFAYNAFPTDSRYDEYFLPPPAFGISLLQGPVVPAPGQTALFDFREVADARNLRMTSFSYMAAGTPISSPPTGVYDGTLEWYNLLRGYTPTTDTSAVVPYVHGNGPNAGQATAFPLAGNPVNGSGDIDGIPNNLSSGERSFAVTSGSFTFADGDTQEVVYAFTGGVRLVGDNISSVAEMNSHISVITSSYDKQFAFPRTRHSISPSGNTTELNVTADLRDFSSVSSVFVAFQAITGSEAPFDLQLFDDGQHGDSLAGDNIWANSTTVTNRRFPYSGQLLFSDIDGGKSYPGQVNQVRLRPLPELKDWQVLYENGQQDGQINTNEKVDYGFTLYNPDLQNAIGSHIITNLQSYADDARIIYSTPLAPGGTVTNSDFMLRLFGPTSGNDSLTFSYRVRFDFHSELVETTVPIVSWSPNGQWQDTLDVTILQGAPGALIPIIADPTLLTGHQYEVSLSLNQPDSTIRWQLKDITGNTLKLTDQMSVDDPQLASPIADGIEWKVLETTAGFAPGDNSGFGIVEVAYAGNLLDPSDYDASGAAYDGNTVWHSNNSTGEYYVSASLAGTLNRLERYIDFAVPNDFEIRWTDYGQGNFAVHGFLGDMIADVPFELWNIGPGTPDDPTDDVRMIPFIYNLTPSATWGWAVETDTWGGAPSSDWVYFLDPIDPSPGTASYDNFSAQCLSDGGPGAIYSTGNTDDYFANLYGGLVYPIGRTIYCDVANTGTPPPAGTVIRYNTTKPLKDGDTYQVLSPVLGLEDDVIPTNFSLEQNYPNPFNPTTDIAFSIAKSSAVQLEIFNVLGQRVRTLVDKKMAPGSYTLNWDSRNESGERVGSGVYFYRLTTDAGFLKTRKMILLR